MSEKSIDGDSRHLPTHIVLVGLMGTGKSSVGRQLASVLHRPFVDTDKKVEARAGKNVRDIFETEGENAFRSLESQIVADVLHSQNSSVIAAAGGVVTQEVNRDVLLRQREDGRCVVVWLQADMNELLGRVKKGVHRPLLDADPSGTLASMARDREQFYEQVASVVVDTSGLTIAEVADEILAQLKGLQ
jgi:shikimate kinase